MDVDENKKVSIRRNFKWFLLILIIPIVINFLIAMINGSLQLYDFKRNLLKILETIKNNISYYGTAFGIYMQG